MKANFPKALVAVLEHEGGFVDHPKDPGGATNKGITIGTLKRIGVDVDGDGDSDLADLKNLRPQDLERVYRLFYWDAVKGDLLPSGLDYAVFDFAVNSGPSRAIQHLQRVLGVEQDGDLGPKTMAAIAAGDAKALVHSLCDSRLRFMRGIRNGELWRTFGKGWQRRVDEVRSKSVDLVTRPTAPVNETPKNEHVSPWAAIIAALLSIFARKAKA